MPTITAVLNPVTRERVQSHVERGKTLFEQLKVPEGVKVWRNGNPYSGEVLQDDDTLGMVVIPQGNEDGKSIARSAIVIGATLLAAALTGPAAGNLGPIARGLVMAGTKIGWTIAANPLIPIQTKKDK
jgi:hypothetical protein